MIFDQQGIFSDAQAITATAASTNALDFGAYTTPYGGGNGSTPDQGKGHKIPLLVQVVEAFDNLTSLKIELELDSTTTFTPDKTIDMGTYLLAELAAGFQIPFDYVPKGVNLQYARLKYTVTGSAPSVGKITAGVVADIQTN